MILKRTEYGTDGNVYELSISNGKEYMTPKMIPIDVLDKIKDYIDHIRSTGMGKEKSLEFIEKFIEGLKAKSEK